MEKVRFLLNEELKGNFEARMLRVKDLISFLLTHNQITTDKEDINSISLLDLQVDGKNVIAAGIDNITYEIELELSENNDTDPLVNVEFTDGFSEYSVIEYYRNEMYRVHNITKNTTHELYTREQINKYIDEKEYYLNRLHEEQERERKYKEEREKELEQERKRQEEYNKDYGFCDGKTALQKGKILKALNTGLRYNGNYMTTKDYIITIIRENEGCYTEEYYNTHRYSKKKINLEYKKLADKLEYRLRVDDGLYELNKTEYLFAKYIIENNIA